MPGKKNYEDKRSSPRYPMQWKVAVVFDEGDQRPTFHGTTNEISLDGMSFYTDHNIFVDHPITLLLAVPPLQQGARPKLVEIRARMVYTVLAAAGVDRFRIGLNFLSFKADGRRFLDTNLKNRAIVTTDNS